MDLNLAFSLAAILALLILSGFFSGSETAMTAASRARMHQLARDGNTRADTVNHLREDKERLIGAILLGNNLVNILASALATSVLITVVGDAAVPIATLVMTLLVLIFSEVMPKTYAIHNAERMALGVAPVLRAVVFVLAPVTAAITWIVATILRLISSDYRDVGMTDYVDELRGAIELHAAAQKETRNERAMLHSILDLANVEVSEIMTHRRTVEAIDADLTPTNVLEAVLQSPYTRIPIWQGEPDNVVGVLHAKDVLRAVQAHADDIEALNILDIASKPWFIPDTTNLQDQLHEFRARREHFALVVDEYGSLQGVVTLEDILEEIVGEIDDEHDLPVAGVRRQPNGSFIVDGTVTIRDLNREFEWRLPDEEASTLAGLVLHEARRIPDVGQTFTFYGFRFEILRRQRHQITSIRVWPPATAVPDTAETDAQA